MRNSGSAVRDRKKRNTVVSGTYAHFTHNSAIKNYLLSFGNRLLAEVSSLDQVWGVGFRPDGPRTNNTCQWGGGGRLLGEVLSAVREDNHDSETGSAHPIFSSRFRTCTANAGTKIYRPPHESAVNSGQRSHRSPFRVSDLLL